MRKDRKFSDEEILDKYITIGAELKILCKIGVFASTRISNCFGKTDKLSKRAKKISSELEQLRSNLEDSMPYNIMTKLCEEKEIDPLNIFYSYEHRNKTNDSQMKIIYDKFLKKIIENEEE